MHTPSDKTHKPPLRKQPSEGATTAVVSPASSCSLAEFGRLAFPYNAATSDETAAGAGLAVEFRYDARAPRHIIAPRPQVQPQPDTNQLLEDGTKSRVLLAAGRNEEARNPKKWVLFRHLSRFGREPSVPARSNLPWDRARGERRTPYRRLLPVLQLCDLVERAG